MLIEDKPHCTIEYDPDRKCITQTWKGFAGSENFRASLMKTIEVVTQYKAQSVISNTQNSKVVSQEDLDWIEQYANPVLMSRGLRKIAFLVPQNVFTRRSIEHFRGQTLATQYFDDLDKARAWVSE